MISHLEDLHLDDEGYQYDDEDEQALSVVHVIPGRWFALWYWYVAGDKESAAAVMWYSWYTRVGVVL